MKRTQLLAALAFCALSMGGPTQLHAALPAQVGETPMPTLAPMIKKVSPSVVSIRTRGTLENPRGPNPLLEDPFFRRFFGDQFPQQGPSQRQFQAAGSGVVVDEKNGYIITNAHVVENASEIAVTTQDGHNFTAKVVGSDPGTDVAVIKLNETDAKLPAITFGDSGNAEVGDFVVAIGNPFGLEHTVTSGIISALGRSGINPDGYEDFIQTDASINPGNSGGALVNLKGELVGINSAIFSGSGGNIGIGFAVPVNLVKNVMGELIQYGEVKRGLLGVNIQTLAPDDTEAVGVPANTQGALVTQVQKGSAAEKAGIKINDVLTSINGHSVKTGGELRNSIGLLRVGDKVEVGLLRDGKPRKVTAVIGQRSDISQVAADFHPNLEGATLEDTEDGGVIVRDVAAGSPAALSGLRPNDVIVGVNRARIGDLNGLKEAARGQKALLLNIRRGGVELGLLVR